MLCCLCPLVDGFLLLIPHFLIRVEVCRWSSCILLQLLQGGDLPPLLCIAVRPLSAL
jgi:hypothetical protein